MGTASQRGRLRHSLEGIRVDVLLSFCYETCSGFNLLAHHISFITISSSRSRFLVPMYAVAWATVLQSSYII